jgi:hypothetical protein
MLFAPIRRGCVSPNVGDASSVAQLLLCALEAAAFICAYHSYPLSTCSESPQADAELLLMLAIMLLPPMPPRPQRLLRLPPPRS